MCKAIADLALSCIPLTFSVPYHISITHSLYPLFCSATYIHACIPNFHPNSTYPITINPTYSITITHCYNSNPPDPQPQQSALFVRTEVDQDQWVVYVYIYMPVDGILGGLVYVF